MLQTSFINEQQIEIINTWIESLEINQTKARGYNNGYSRIESLGVVPLEVIELRQRLLFIFPNSYFESLLGDFVMEINKDGWVGLHTDTSENSNYIPMRGVVLIQKPFEGGNIVVKNKSVTMDEGDLLILNTMEEHGVTTVKGDKPYRILSFGFLVPKQNYEKYM